MNKYLFFAAVLVSLLLSACDDGIVIGEDILNEEEINTGVTDDFTLSAVTVPGEPIYTFVQDRDRQTYTLGEIDDPIFGKYSSDMYLSLTYASFPDYSDSVLDSMVLVMEYDTIGFYGDSTAVHDVNVYRVVEKFSDLDSINADQELARGDLLGSRSLVPEPLDSVTIDSRLDVGEKIKTGPQLRIPLNTPEAIAIAEQLVTDTMLAESSEKLVDFLNGLYIEARSGGVAMLGLRMDAAATGSLIMYTTKSDTLKQAFAYRFNNEVFAHVEHDYAGSVVEAFVGDEQKGDSLLFLQGLVGLDAEINLPELSAFENRIINKATLTLTVAELQQDFPLDQYPIDRQLFGNQIDDDGDRVLVDDIIKLGATASGISNGLVIFGGRPETVDLATGEQVRQYELNITDYLQRLAAKGKTDAKLILTPFSREQSPRNTVFYGPGHSTYPIKLRINFTEI